MDHQALQEITKFIRAPSVKCRKGQNYEAHDFFEDGAEEQSANQRMLGKKIQSVACAVVNSSGRAGDEIVEQDSEQISFRRPCARWKRPQIGSKAAGGRASGSGR